MQYSLSLAFKENVAFEHVLRARTWKAQSIFSALSLRDNTHKSWDITHKSWDITHKSWDITHKSLDLFSIGPMVATQQDVKCTSYLTSMLLCVDGLLGQMSA